MLETSLDKPAVSHLTSSTNQNDTNTINSIWIKTCNPYRGMTPAHSHSHSHPSPTAKPRPPPQSSPPKLGNLGNDVGSGLPERLSSANASALSIPSFSRFLWLPVFPFQFHRRAVEPHPLLLTRRRYRQQCRRQLHHQLRRRRYRIGSTWVRGGIGALPAENICAR